MRFLAKTSKSAILHSGMKYRESGDNGPLRNALIGEQNGFCAYTEKYLEPLDSVEVEHFDSSLKKKDDDYWNYYAVIRKANLYKKDEKYIGATFFASKFFHDNEKIRSRIGYAPGNSSIPGTFYEIDETDVECRDLIDFLGCNDLRLSLQRQEAIDFLREKFLDSNWTTDQLKAFFLRHRRLLSFPTAIEAEFGIDLGDVITQKTGI
jgi:hypothetical protein